MVYYITVPPKKGYDVDLIKPLQNFISRYYSSCDNQTNLTCSIEQLNKLRQNCVSKTLDLKTENSLEIYQKYYDQLVSFQNKCIQNEIQIPFKWKNSYDKGSSFLYSTGNLTISDIQYEKVCVLFNIASISTQICLNQLNEALINDSALKKCAKLYQSAGGIFKGLKHLVGSIEQELTWDLNIDVLSELSIIMLAQAQEIFFIKAFNNGMKNNVMAKICNHCKNLYRSALNNIQLLNSEKDEEVISLRLSIFTGLAEYYQALTCQEEKKFGEQIARFEKAIELLKSANLKANSFLNTNFNHYLEKAIKLNEEAKKDNDFIYHERIPEYKSLDPIDKAEIAKLTPIPDSFLKNHDLFENLLPLSVQQAIIKFDTRRAYIISTEINDLNVQTQNMNSFLNTMNLPACIEHQDDKNLPPSIIDKCKHVKSEGGFLAIENKYSKLPELKKRNEEILLENENQIEEEEKANEILKKKYGKNWIILDSNKVNDYWKEQISKFKTIIKNADNADKLIFEKYMVNKLKITNLSKSENELLKLLPHNISDSNNLNTNIVLTLKSLMNEIDILKKERESLEDEIKNIPCDDIKTKFLEALRIDGNINEEVLSVETIGQIYGPIQKRIRENKEKQNNLLQKIQVSHDEFSKLRGSFNSNDRNSFISDLAKTYNLYFEIMNNIKEGTNFYNDLTKLLVNLQNKINDFCFARKTEREELVESLKKENIDNLVNSFEESKINSKKESKNLPYPNPYQQYFYSVPTLITGYPNYPLYLPGQYNPLSFAQQQESSKQGEYPPYPKNENKSE